MLIVKVNSVSNPHGEGFVNLTDLTGREIAKCFELGIPCYVVFARSGVIRFAPIFKYEPPKGIPGSAYEYCFYADGGAVLRGEESLDNKMYLTVED